MQQKIGTLRLALTFAGCFLGAGYVSGQELWQYFGAFGARGLLGLVLAVALLGGTGVLLLRLSARTGIETMDALIVRADIPWLRTAVGVLTAALLFGVVCIMAAGIGALGNQMLGLPVWLGAAIACVLIAAAAYFGLGGMVSVFTVAVPCMIVAALVIAGIRLHRTELTAAAFAAGDTNPMLGSWATSAVNYAAYNFFATVGRMFAAEFLSTDYGALGVLCVMVFYLFRRSRIQQVVFGCLAFVWWEWAAVFAFVPIFYYNGKRGFGMKYFFYAFYPVHLLILYLIVYKMGYGSVPAI